MRRPIAAGNWKMNGLKKHKDEILDIDNASRKANCDVILCVPSTITVSYTHLTLPTNREV